MPPNLPSAHSDGRQWSMISNTNLLMLSLGRCFGKIYLIRSLEPLSAASLQTTQVHILMLLGAFSLKQVWRDIPDPIARSDIRCKYANSPSAHFNAAWGLLFGAALARYTNLIARASISRKSKSYSDKHLSQIANKRHTHMWVMMSLFVRLGWCTVQRRVSWVL